MKILARYYLILAVFSCDLLAQREGSLVGRVIDEASGAALPGANVVLRGTVRGTVSSPSGAFRIASITPGRYTLVVSLIGFKTASIESVEVKSGEQRDVVVSLMQVPVETEQVVVTASRREQSLEEVPVSISTVTARTLADRVAVNLDDALRYVPGVNMMQDQVNIRGSTGYSRGVGSRVLVLIDGLPYLTGDTGEITWETLPMHQVERIEVVKGGGSALYGSSALGGVINVITKEIPEGTELRFRMYSGMYDRPRYAEWDWSPNLRFNSGGFVTVMNNTGNMGYLVSLSRSVDESYRENDVYHRWDLFSKLKYNFSESQNLTVVGNIMRRSHGNFFWWKSLREATRPAESQRGGNVDWNRGNLSFSYKELISDRLTYTLRGIYYGNFWKDDSSGRVNNVSASHVTQVEGQGTYEIAPDHFLTFGLVANYDFVTSNIFGNHPGVGMAGYVQDEVAVSDGFRITSGLRFDWQRVSVLPVGSRLDPKLGAVYTPAAGTRFRASFAAGFRYPSISELFTGVSTGVSQLAIVPNPDSLKAERSYSYEVGYSQKLFNQFFVELSLFQNDFEDLIEAGVTERGEIKFSNVTKARIRGIEAGLRSEWFDNLLHMDLSYTYTDPRDIVENTVLKFRSKHMFYSSLQLNAGELRASADFRYISRVEAIDERLVILAPIVQGDYRVPIKLLDVRASYGLNELGPPFRIGLNVNNVLNYSYVELIGNLSPVRTYILSIEGAL